MGTETIGERLKRLRLERGLSQRELAAPGVSYAYISRIEGETRRPSVKALRKLAERLGVSVEYLETGEERTRTDDLAAALLDRVGVVTVSLSRVGARVRAGAYVLEDATITEGLAALVGYVEERDRARARDHLAVSRAFAAPKKKARTRAGAR